MYQLGSSPFFDDKGNEIGKGGSDHLPRIGSYPTWDTPHGKLIYSKSYWEQHFPECRRYTANDVCWDQCDEYGFAEGDDFCRPLALEGVDWEIGACGPVPLCSVGGEIKFASGHPIKGGKIQLSLGGLALAGIAYLVFFKK